MSYINDGGPAFPNRGDRGTYDGMSLRDYFAAKVVQGLVAHGYADEGTSALTSEDCAAIRAFIIADAMVAARERTSE